MVQPRFDPTINLGHVLTTVVLVGGLIASWTTLQAQQVQVRERVEAHDRVLDTVKSGMQAQSERTVRMETKIDAMAETIGDLKQINRPVGR